MRLRRCYSPSTVGAWGTADGRFCLMAQHGGKVRDRKWVILANSVDDLAWLASLGIAVNGHSFPTRKAAAEALELALAGQTSCP